MQEYIVEYLTPEMAGERFNYCYDGEWGQELVVADNPASAIEELKQLFISSEILKIRVEQFLYRVRTMDADGSSVYIYD